MKSSDLKPTVFVVDDDQSIREMLELMLSSNGHQVSCYETPTKFLEEFDDQPGCLLLDIRMPEMSGLAVQEELIRRQVLIPIIFITGHGDIEMAVDCIQKGAFDFIEKPFREQALLDKIDQALANDYEARQSDRIKQEILQRIDSLTGREKEIMNLIASGQANKVIAIDLGIAQGTVEIHRSRVMHKMGVRSVAQLMRMLVAADALTPASNS